MIRTARTVVGEFFGYVMRVGVFLVAGPLMRIRKPSVA